MTRVKVCGITSLDDALMCLDAGVDELGFVVEYPAPVPWSLTREEAARMMAVLPPGPARVAVVAGTADAILELAAAVRPDALQLHGDEDEATVARVARGVAGAGVRIVKAIRVPPGPGGAADPGRWHDLAVRFAEAGADEILFDSASARRPGGSGERFDWAAVRRAVAARPRPVVLAGGLTPANVAEAVRAVGPDGVDVISGVEGARHRKDPALVRAFVAAARRA